MIAKLKRKIISMFEQILSHTHAYNDLYEMRKNLNRVTVLNYEVMPSILPLGEKSKKIFSEIEHMEGFENVSLEISKDDLMFHFWLHHLGSVDKALKGYFSSGYEQAVIVKEILQTNFSDISKLYILDFASGHGRVSRYFKSFLPVDNITIAEIKQQAVDFQKNVFGYKGFASFPHPAQLAFDEKFDFILVSSLFTHLNKKLFSLWLEKLGAMVKDNGLLSLSLHLISAGNEGVFIYTEQSEDDMFAETSSNLAGKNIYGLTSLNNIEFRQLVFANLGTAFQIIDERAWGDSQVLMSIQKSPPINIGSSLKF